MTVSEHYVTFHFSFRFVTNANQNFYLLITGTSLPPTPLQLCTPVSASLTLSALFTLHISVRLDDLLRHGLLHKLGNCHWLKRLKKNIRP